MTSPSVEQIFEIKQKFLREIPHPKLIMKQINRLDEQPVSEEEVVKIDFSDGLLLFLEQYMSTLLEIKLKIANAAEAAELRKYLINLYFLQQQLITNLSVYYPANQQWQDVQIKLSDSFDVYGCIKELKKHDISENQIKNYLCQQFENGPGAFTELLVSVLRARKIEEHGR